MFGNKSGTPSPDQWFAGWCREVIHEIAPRRPRGVDDFIGRLAAYRGREIVRVRVPAGTPAPVCLLLADRTTDYMVLSAGLSPVQDDQFAGHEAAHLALGHPGEQIGGGEWRVLSALLPDLTLDGPVAVHRRTTYATEPERQAELFGSILAAELSRLGGALLSGRARPDALHSLFGARGEE